MRKKLKINIYNPTDKLPTDKLNKKAIYHYELVRKIMLKISNNEDTYNYLIALNLKSKESDIYFYLKSLENAGYIQIYQNKDNKELIELTNKGHLLIEYYFEKLKFEFRWRLLLESSYTQRRSKNNEKNNNS